MNPHFSRIFPALCALGVLVGGARRVEARTQCPPEEWFCDDDTGAGAPEAPEPSDQDGDEPAEASPREPPAPASPAPDLQGRGKIDLGAGAVDDESTLAEASSPWSISLRLQGVALGAGAHDAGLGGIGVSLRYFLLPSVALDLGLDSFGGTDYNGFDRSEGSLSLSTLLYLNPRQALRTFVILGLHVSEAQVNVRGDDQDWSYLGGHAGLGLEFLIGTRASVGVDMLGFIRGRTDQRAAREPEFDDGFGNQSNVSGGGLFRGSVSLYW